MVLKTAIGAFVALLMVVSSALADDWVVTKLRGVALQQVDGGWINLERGGIVADDRAIRTLANAQLELQRDGETLELGPDTQISINDKTGQRYTIVRQAFGELIVDAEVRNVEHFAVETPYLAAVVKGTRFTVTSGTKGASVKVSRGQVVVEDLKEHLSALVTAGQSATSGTSQPLVVLSATGSVVSGVIEDTTGIAGDVIDNLGGDGDGLIDGVLDGVDGILGKGSPRNTDGNDGDPGSGGVGIDVNLPGIGIHL